ncbi:MAG: protein kinase [Oscillochloris sp.]|nr:protein kinase [Oscillochloris sp.]
MAEVTQILCPICHKPNLRRARFCQHCGHDIVLNNDRPSDGRRYVITRVIKQGGQGAVYEGIDESGQIFAIKEMLDKFTDPKERNEAIERFNAEADLLQGLSHPRIPRIYSHFTDEGRHYLTMDFVRGKDLEQLVDEHSVLPETEVLGYADQICDVLVYLHGRNLIYRDMKPSNVMLDESGSIKLVDFGITKLFKPTERGTQIGTPGYAPPEQYQGLATPASDIYALGATLHHLLTGRDPTEQMPFDFPAASSVNSSVSKRTSDALQRALQKVPQDRFATMSDFWDALRPERAKQPVQVRVAQPTVQLPQQPAAQMAGAPAMTGTAATAPARPAPVRPAPTQPTVPAKPAPAPTRPTTPPAKPTKQRRGFLTTVAAVLSWMFTLLILVVIGLGGYVYVSRPAWADQYMAPILHLGPTTTPTAAPALTSRQISFDLEIQVPSGSDATTIRNAFIAAFEAQAKAQYGSDTRINMNVAPSAIGGQATLINETNTVSTYQATFQGFIYTP